MRPKIKLFQKKTNWLKTTFLILIIIAIYYPAFSFDFVDHDDLNFIVNNPVLTKGFSSEGLRWAFTAGLTEETLYIDYWQPITVISRMLDVQLYGMDPRGHHATNILLHIFNAFLIWIIFTKLIKHPSIAYLTAIFFAVHPLQVEPVVWVTARKDLLSVFFGLLSMLAYLRYCEGSCRIRSYLTCFFLFLLGILSKPSIGILFVVFFLIDIWPLKRFDGKLSVKLIRIAEKIPFLLAFVAVMWVPLIAIPVSMSYYPKIIMFQMACLHYFIYLMKIVIPTNLSLYPSVFTYEYAPWVYVAAILVLVLLSVYFLKALFRKRPEIGFGWFWFALLLIPFAPVNTPGDRFAYLPITGVIFMAVSALSKFASRNKFDGTLSKIILIVSLLVLSIASHVQTFVWKDTVTLFEHALKVNVKNQLVQNDYGAFLSKQGRSEEALTHFLIMQGLRQQRFKKVKDSEGKLFI